MYKDINVNVSGPQQPTATYKTKVLKGNHSFASQITEPNMKYVIKHNFVLDNDITIPENCVLEFDGGSISGEHTITFQNTVIEKNAKILCDIAGTLLGNVDVSWFGLKSDDSTYDNGIAINKASIVSKSIYIPAGLYYFSTPVFLNDMNVVNFNGTLHYNGTLQDNVAVKIAETKRAKIDIYNIECDYDRIDYTEANNTNAIGILFENCSTCNINVIQINNFNVGICFKGNGAGCSYNLITIKVVRSFNYGIWLTQDNGGYTNENYIRGCRFQPYSSSVGFPDLCHAFYMKGSTPTDSYDQINDIHIQDCCAEGFGDKAVIYARNISYLYVEFIRMEDSNCIFKPEASARYISIDANSYGMTDILSKIDASLKPNRLELLNIPTPNSFNVERPKGFIASAYIKYFIIRSGVISNIFDPTKTYEILGAEFSKPYSQNLYFDIRNAVISGIFAFIIEVVDDNGNIIQDFDPENYAPLSNRAFSYNVNGFQSNNQTQAYLYFNKHVTKVFVGVQILSELNKGIINHNCGIVEIGHLLDHGATTERPTLIVGNSGFQYFDTTLGKPIYWTGTAWVDATGATV